MSHDDRYVLQRKIGALRRLHDQLQRKVQFGPMGARELWDDLEKRWNHLEVNANQLAPAYEGVPDGVVNVVRDTITELRRGYCRLASTLREANPENLWDQFQKFRAKSTGS